MQSVKMLLRQVGVPSKELDIISAGDLDEYIQYQFTSQGYKLHTTHYVGDVRDSSGGVVGYKVMLWFTRDEQKAKVA